MQENQEQFQLLRIQVGCTLEQFPPSHQFLHDSQHIARVLTFQHREQSISVPKLIQQLVMLSQLNLLGPHNQVIPLTRFLTLPSMEIPKMGRPQHLLLSAFQGRNSLKQAGLTDLLLLNLVNFPLASIDNPIGGPNHTGGTIL
ncbi:hypothetical protein Fmac_032307 [Flemingia macrophylla]|uniref:Maturase K n=1 Tax=Flemingia macrophylla TaxID=520843 RepID=A0ABD1L4I6_9FABA